jgi:cytochrome b pre-mRNA-processing protein 3
MILAHWRARRANRNLIDQIHGKIVAAARRPTLYADLGVPDTFEGRFEMVTLHAALVMRRSMKHSGAGAELAHEIGDSVFRHFDVVLRETGLGDIAVAKRLKRMAEAFYGRSKAYGEGLEEPDTDRLSRALARNVYGVADVVLAPMAPRLAEFVRAAADTLDRTPFETLAAGDVEFPAPKRVAAQTEAGHG